MPIFWSVRRMVCTEREPVHAGQHHVQNGGIAAGLLLQQRQGRLSALSASTASIPGHAAGSARSSHGCWLHPTPRTLTI